MKKHFIFVFLFLVSLNFVLGATTSVAEFTYNFNSTAITISNRNYNPPVLLRIKTPIETTCYWNTLNTTIYGIGNGNPFSLFEGISNHEQSFSEADLKQGLNRYYVQCGNSSNPVMSVSFDVKKEISANIYLSESDPLKAGVYQVILNVSRPTFGTPTLEYSLDGIVYDPLPLEVAGDKWKTQLVIEKNAGEVIGSFRFKATDLDGTLGTRIDSQSTFLVDTVAPSVIENLEATGYLGEIKLTWYLDEKVKEYEIYKSENPGVDFTRYYDSSEDEDFLDTNVETGKTYYYKVLAVDEAGNKGSFSREISATALISNSHNQTGLSQKLIGKVDNNLVELGLLREDIQDIQSSISSRDENEKMLFENLDLNKEIVSALSELDSLEKDVERYKLQDLSEIELDQKLNQAILKMDIIKKKIPESITIIDQYGLKREIFDTTIELMTLEVGQDSMTDNQQKKTISLTKDLLKNNPLIINSIAYSVSVSYLDGTTQKKSLIMDTLDSTIERSDNVKLFVSIPSEVAEKYSEIDFLAGSPHVIKENLLLSFEADTKKLIYKLDKEIDPNNIENIVVVPLDINNDEINRRLLTGFAVFQGTEMDGIKIGIVLGVIVILLLTLYLVITRKNRYSEELIKILELIEEGKLYLKEKSTEKLKKTYGEIQKSYVELAEKEKRKIYKKIKKFHEK